ncbi:MAG TPA: DUF4233 domain-containing protein [Naasia sp.]|jgi:hypothetical protein
MARARRIRTVRESLGSIVLGMELLVVFLAALVASGLGALPPLVALAGGAGLILLLIIAMGTLRSMLGVVLGWIAQAVLVAGGFLIPELFLVGILFVAIWTYCMIMGARIDRRQAGGTEPRDAGEKE